ISCRNITYAKATTAHRQIVAGAACASPARIRSHLERAWSRHEGAAMELMDRSKLTRPSLLALAVLGALLAPRAALSQADGPRILSYNTSLMYFRGSYPGPIAAPCLHCDPFRLDGMYP